jgi:hypothetical protein
MLTNSGTISGGAASGYGDNVARLIGEHGGG